MKRFFLFLFASLLSISMFAQNDGSTKAKAVPYAWGEGIKVTSEAGVGKWYVVDLYGRFDPATGKSAEGNADANIVVANPLDERANVDVTAYVGDNETSRHFSLAPGEFKTMNIGAGMLVRMGIRYVYMFIVMDVDIPIEQAEKIEVVVEDAPANSTPFVPIDFNWAGFPAKTGATVIPANKETWVTIDFENHGVTNGKTYKFYVEKDNATPITVAAGISYDCPASSIQEQSAELKSAETAKVLDEAKLSMIPGTIYLRLKASQELRIYAEEVNIPAPQGDPIFNINNAIEVLLWDEGHQDRVYTLDAGHLVYSVDYATLQADENYYRQIEVTNNGTEEVTIVGKAAKTYYDHNEVAENPDPTKDGNVYSAVSKTVVIPAGQTYTKKIDKTMQNVVGAQAGDKIWALGPEFPNVTFKLTQQPVDPEYCKNATDFEWDEWNQQNGGYKWYAVNILAAKNAKADINLTMETINPEEEANITVDLAAVCQLGEPTQNYTGKSKSTTKTLSYSLFANNNNNVMYVRVRTDKAIKVKAELQTTKTWNGTAWSGDGQAPDLDEAARIEGNLTIANGVTIKALGLTLASGKITIENGGKLIVGTEGIKGSNAVDQIVIEEGGKLFIDPACTTNNKPFITAQKSIKFGQQLATGHQLPELHDFIALPIEDREAGINGVKNIYYANWIYTEGWRTTDNFRKAFVGYNVYIPSSDATCPDDATNVPVEFKGRLAANKDQTLAMPGEGWHAFGNSWFDAIDVANIYNQLGGGEEKEVAVHKYVAVPQDVNGVPFKDNQYALITAENKAYVTDEFKVVASMQGFFLYTAGAKSITLDYNSLFNTNKAAAAPAKRAESNNATNVAVVVRGGNGADHVFMVEKAGSNVHKMMGNGLALYAEDGLGQVANSNLIGTILTLQTNEATEYTLSFAWLNGETLYLKDLVNGNIVEMTAENTYTFNAEPNTVSDRFQVIGRNNIVTGIENSAAIQGANKFIENGKIVIIKNGVKYNVLGAQL